MTDDLHRITRERFERGELRLGGGELGGKANGLVFFNAMLANEFDATPFRSLKIGVPAFAVVGTDVFDEFVARGGFDPARLAEMRDHEIATAFLKVDFPEAVVEKIRVLLEVTHQPLAVRSSSLMEDAIFRPFAGVYGTKMIPNNQADSSDRVCALVDAIKLVYASTFFRAARSYIHATEKSFGDEKMAIVIQEIVGRRLGSRFYPLLSGVGRSYNFYPTGGATPEEGVVCLALGLGRMIVEGGLVWTYSPARPQAPQPYSSVGQLMDATQRRFWCVDLESAGNDVAAEGQYLVQLELNAAEADGVLRYVASTYDGSRDRLVPGTGVAGPRVLDFAPLLVYDELPIGAAVSELLAICERAAGAAVEIEFALSPPAAGAPAELGFLQVRPMFVSHEMIEIGDDEMKRDDVLVASTRVMGNGRVDGITDVVYVRPETFQPRHTPAIAAEVERINDALFSAGRPYLLIGFGRWGSSDTSLGIPVDWGQIGGAKVIVEATLPNMDVEASQGAHFFHNMTGNGIAYLSIHHTTSRSIDWTWLDAQPATSETELLRHVRLERPLEIRLDGRSQRGVVWTNGG